MLPNPYIRPRQIDSPENFPCMLRGCIVCLCVPEWAGSALCVCASQSGRKVFVYKLARRPIYPP